MKFQLTPAREFRRNREEGVPVELPSTGRRVALRSFRMDAFVATAQIPDELTAYVERVLIGAVDGEAPTAHDLGMSQIEFVRTDRALLELYAQYTFVYPKVRPSTYTGELADDEILASDLEYAELLEAFAAVQLPATRLESFRDQALPAVVALRASGETQNAGQ